MPIAQLTRRPILGALAVGLGAGPAMAQQSDAYDGDWYGVLAGPNLRLRLTFAAGAATLYSLDQGDAAIPAGSVEIRGARVALTFPEINGRFEGALSEDRLVGEWRQGARLPLTFTRRPVEAAPAEPLTAARLATLRARAEAPALAAASVSRANASLALADGVRRMDRDERVTTSDLWHVGSITKSMTATLAARAVEAGAISWDDRVGDVLGPEIPDMRAEYRDATYRHLLSHRAGLPAQISMIDFLRYPRESADARGDRLDYARKALRQTPVGPLGESFLYSNSGYVVAGAMLEARLGASWENLIRERLFEPLGMTRAGFGAPGTARANDQPAGHAEGLLRNAVPHPPGEGISDNPAVLGPAGRVHAPMADMLRFLNAHRDRASLLRPETWTMLHTPPFGGDYALGLVKRGDALWHNGSNTLWYAEILIDPAAGVSAIAACNSGRLSHMAPVVAEALAGAAAAVR